MRKKWLNIFITIFIACMFAAGCDEQEIGYNPDGPIPEGLHPKMALNYTEAEVDAMVTVEAETILPYRDLIEYGVCEDLIPDRYDCNNITFIRYRLNNEILDATEDPATAEYADMGFIMVPGIYEGAGGFEYIARHLVYKAYRDRGLKTEVWAMDRRNNCIEDRVGADVVESMLYAAQEAGSDGGTSITETEENDMIDTAVEYYYGNLEIDGKTFEGWYSNGDVPYLSEFGLKMDTEDMYQIIKTMVPNQEDRKSKVFVGGHSLGGIHTGLFASWDFDGSPITLDDAGYNNTAGLFCFDSIVTPLDKAVNHVVKNFIPIIGDHVVGFGENLTWPVYEAALLALRTGVLPRFGEGMISELVTGSPIGPEMVTLVEAVGALAYALPDKEHTAIQKIYPFIGDDVKSTLQKYISRNQLMLDQEWPTVLDFRFTNEAFLGLFFDDDFSHIGMIVSGFGFMYGGSIAPKEDTGSGLFVPTDAGPYECTGEGCEITAPGPLYKWADFDEVARPGDDFKDTEGTTTFTTYTNEGSDIQGLARSLFKGESNMIEWYFGLRRMVDMLAAVADWGPLYGINTFYQHSALVDMPVIEFIAEDGVIAGGDGPMGLPLDISDLPINPVMLEGADHMDPMYMSGNTYYRDDDNVIEMLLDWAEDNI